MSGTNSNVVNLQAAAQTANQPVSTANNAERLTATSTTSTNTSQVGNLKLQFESNEFNQYDRVSYVFQLCMINELDAEDPDLLSKFLANQIRTVVIAESGVTTGFSIGDVEIIDGISPNFRNRSNLTTSLRLQIIEPYGLTLPDRMYQGSQELGIRNWRLAPFLLKLEFRYIKSDGTYYTPSGNQKLIKVYQLLITDFDAQLTETGAKYDVQAGVKGNLGFMDAYQILPHSHRIDTQQSSTENTNFGVPRGDNTVGTFFTKLGEIITNMYLELRQNNAGGRLPILIYKFQVEPELARQEINFSAELNSRRASFTTGSASTGEVLVSRGISVTALVDDIIASLKDPAFLMQTFEQGGLIKIPVIECITRNVGWDLLTENYVREFTFVIRTKLSNRPVPNEEYGSAVQNNNNLQQSRLVAVSKNLKKRYDYYYTGRNTEIISCDIKFNQLHVIPQHLLDVTLPVSLASSSSVNPNNPSVTNRPSITNLGDQLTQERRELDRISTSLNRLGSERSLSEADLARESALLTQERQDIQERIATLNSQSVIPFEGNQETNNLLRPVTNTSEQARQFQQAVNRARQNSGSRSARVYAEDLRSNIQNNMLRLSYYADPRDILNNMARPVNIESGDANNTSSTTRPLVTSILQQIYDKSGQHLLEIDLEIRGDPYWLGATDLERTQELKKFLDQLSVSNSGVPDRLSGNTRPGEVDKHDQDANILLKFRAGSAPDAHTGFMNLKDDSTFFYGIYTVIECVHEFRGGKFTQKLKAFRDTLINVDQLRAADSTSLSSNQPRAVTTQGTPVPESQSLLTARAEFQASAARSSASISNFAQLTAADDAARLNQSRQEFRTSAAATSESISRFMRLG